MKKKKKTNWNGKISIIYFYLCVYMAWDTCQSTWFTIITMKIVEMNWSENIVIAIVSFVTWFIIHNNEKETKKNEKNPRTIPMMTMSRDILFVHTLFFLCSLYTKPNHFIKTKTFCQNKWKIWVSQIKRVSMQMDRITRDDEKKLYIYNKTNKANINNFIQNIDKNHQRLI